MSQPSLSNLCLFSLAALVVLPGCPSGGGDEDGTTFATFSTTMPTTGDGDGDMGGTMGETGGMTGDGDGDATTTGDPPANCGDGIVDPDEECDLGDENSNTGQCTEACTIATCGDGYVYEGFEECDDGNNINTDECVTPAALLAVLRRRLRPRGRRGCATTATTTNTDGCLDTCDARRAAATASFSRASSCDDGNDDGRRRLLDTLPVARFAVTASSTPTSRSATTATSTTTTSASRTPVRPSRPAATASCVEGIEECDDGNVDRQRRLHRQLHAFAVCGDGIVQEGVEECDDGNDVDDDFCSNDCISDGWFDDFESNDFNVLPWDFVGTNWVIANNNPHQGSYSAANGDINDNGSSGLEVVVDAPANGVVQFWYRVSSESSFDYLRFFIDNVEQDEWSGAVNWTQASYNLNPGQHTLRWTYSKDGSVSSGEDTAYIDEVYIGNSPP